MLPTTSRWSRNAARRLRVALPGVLLLLGALGLTACGDDDPTVPEPTVNTGFDGGYELENWRSWGITGGTTSLGTVAGTEEQEARFSYEVDLGNPGGGVPRRTATFSIVCPKSGTMIVEWTYTGFHAFHRANAELHFFAYDSAGTAPRLVTGVAYQAAGGGFSFAGTDTIAVVQDQRFGITLGGDNNDSNSYLNGVLHITRLTTPL